MAGSDVTIWLSAKTNDIESPSPTTGPACRSRPRTGQVALSALTKAAPNRQRPRSHLVSGVMTLHGGKLILEDNAPGLKAKLVLPHTKTDQPLSFARDGHTEATLRQIMLYADAMLPILPLPRPQLATDHADWITNSHTGSAGMDPHSCPMRHRGTCDEAICKHLLPRRCRNKRAQPLCDYAWPMSVDTWDRETVLPLPSRDLPTPRLEQPH